MSFNTDKLSYFHSFSKTPVQSGTNFADGTTLGNAINKSGHTVTASEVWAQDIPYYGKMGSLADVIAKVQPYARKNDMCYITAGDDKGKTYIYDGTSTWTLVNGDGKLTAGQLLKNSKDENVLLYHEGEKLTNLTAANNANTDSANNAARLWTNLDVDGTSLGEGVTRLVEQFVAPTDKALNGLASVAFAPGIGTLVSGTDYYDYCFSGTILWASASSAARNINCFEYVGSKVSTVVDTVATQGTTLQSVKDQVETISDALGLDPEPGQSTLGERVTTLEEGVEDLTERMGDVEDTLATGVVASVSASQAAQTAGVTASTTDKAVTIDVTVGTVAENVTAVVTGGAVHTAIETAKSTLNSSIEAAAKKAADDLSTARGEITTEIEGAASAAQSAAEGTAASALASARTEITSEIETAAGAAQAAAEGTAAAALSGAVSELEGKISKAQTDAETNATAAAKGYTDTEVKKVSDSLSTALEDHAKDIETVQAAITALSTSGFSRVIVTELPTTDIKLNAIYLIQNTNSEAGEYIEYIYVGELGEGGTGSVDNFEQIGSTKTDLSEYAKTAEVTETLKSYTTTEVHNALDARVTAAESTIAANTAAAQAAQDAADAAQGEVDALEGVVAELTTTVGNNKTAAETGIQEAKDAAKAADDKAVAAQGEVDALEVVVSTLSQTVADNKSTTDAAIALKADQTALDETNETITANTAAIATINDTTIPGITGRLDAIEAIPTVEVVASTAADQYITVTPATADGKTTYTVGTTAALEDRLDAIDQFLGDNEDKDLSDLLAKKVNNVTGGTNGITITTADTEAGRIATLSVAPDTEVIADSVKVITSGAVASAISSAKSTLQDAIDAKVAQTAYDEKIEELEGAIATKAAQSDHEALAARVTTAEGEIDALQEYVATGAATQIKNAIEELDSSKDSAGVAVVQENGVITSFTVTPGSVAANDTSVVAGGAVYTAIEGEKSRSEAAYAVKSTETVAANAVAAAATAQQTADSKATLAEATAAAKELADAVEAKIPTEYVSSITIDGDEKLTNGVAIKSDTEMAYGPQTMPTYGYIKLNKHSDSNTITIQNSGLWDINDLGMMIELSKFATSRVLNDVLYNASDISVAKINFNNLTANNYLFNSEVNLTSFVSDLSNLINGESFFGGASNLSTFKADLASLDKAGFMFGGCILSAESVMYIADGIKDWGASPAKAHEITIDVDASLTSDEEVAEYLAEIANKGWTVATNHTAYATAAISEQSTSGVYVIARPSTQERATHVTADGKYVAIESAVSVIGPHVSQWSIYPSVEDAIMDMELTAI